MNFILLIAIVKSGLSNKNAEQVLTQLRFVIASLNGNPNFPMTNPSLVELQEKETQLANAIAAAIYGGSHLIAIRDDIVGKVMQLMTSLVADINLQSDGDEEKALSSGLPKVATRVPAGLLPAPAKARGKALGNSRIVINWGGLKGRSAYRVYSNTDPNIPAAWVMQGEISKTRLVIEELTPGTLYYFYIVGVNNFGEGACSDIVAVRSI